uniref:Uncharacterized protein n=1 Tax=Anguilla anguilla TaxID=7936 RepID=A0A0E9WR09_ANGAN
MSLFLADTGAQSYVNLKVKSFLQAFLLFSQLAKRQGRALGWMEERKLLTKSKKGNRSPLAPAHAGQTPRHFKMFICPLTFFFLSFFFLTTLER